MAEWVAANPAVAAAWEAAEVENKERKAATLSRQERKQGAKRLAKSFPCVALDAAWEPAPTPAVEVAKSWLERDKSKVWCLLLLGNRGQGKTVAACHVAIEMQRRFESLLSTGQARAECLFVAATEFSRLSSYQKEDQAYFESLKHAPLVVVDDLGTERFNPVAQEHFHELIDYRTGRRLPMVLTSNLLSSEFKERYGERIADRLKSCSMIHEGTGPSLRRVPT